MSKSEKSAGTIDNWANSKSIHQLENRLNTLTDDTEELVKQILGVKGYEELYENVMKETDNIYKSIDLGNLDLKQFIMTSCEICNIILPKDLEQYLKNLDDVDDNENRNFIRYLGDLFVEFINAFKSKDFLKNFFWELIIRLKDNQEEKIKIIKRFLKNRLHYYDVKALEYVVVDGIISWKEYRKLLNTLLWRKGKMIKYMLNEMNNVKQPEWENCELHHENPYPWEHLFSEGHIIKKREHKRGGNLLKPS